jgi:hypothetical protein
VQFAVTYRDLLQFTIGCTKIQVTFTGRTVEPTDSCTYKRVVVDITIIIIIIIIVLLISVIVLTVLFYCLPVTGYSAAVKHVNKLNEFN